MIMGLVIWPLLGLAEGQWRDLGKPLRRDFKRETTFSGEAIYNGIITREGMLLLGGDHSLFHYDGRTWGQETLRQNAFITDFAEDGEGNLWVGANGEIGFFQNFEAERFSRYVSMTDLASKGDQVVETIFRVTRQNEFLFFQGHSKVYVWDGNFFQTFTFNSDYRIESFLFEGAYYVSGRDTLFRWDGNDFLAEADFAGRDLGFISSLYRGNGDTILCLSGTGDIYSLAQGTLSRVAKVPDLENVSESAWTSRGTVLALDTQKGLLEVRPDGRVLRQFEPGVDLPTGFYQTFIREENGGVWVLGSFGVSRLGLDSPAWLITKDDLPEEGAIQDASLLGDTLYVATSRGVFRSLDGDSQGKANGDGFEMISSVGTGLKFIPLPDGRLLHSRLGGIVSLGPEGIQGLSTQVEEKLFTDVKTSSVDGGWDILLDRYQVYLASRNADGWDFLDQISHQSDYPLQICEVQAGVLFLSESSSGLVKIQYNDQGRFLSRTEIESIGDTVLLGKRGFFGQLGSQSFYFSGDRLFQWREGRWIPRELSLPEGIAPGGEFTQISRSSSEHSLWLSYSHRELNTRSLLLLKTGNTSELQFQFYPHHGLGFKGPIQSIENHDTEDGSYLLLSGRNKVKWIQLDGEWPSIPTLKPVLNLVAGKDGRPTAENPTLSPGEEIPEFHYRLPAYTLEAPVAFQSRLVGLSGDWSPPSLSGKSIFPGLRAGNYAFEVRAVHPSGFVGPTTRLSFRIIPPWYQTPWGWATFAAAGLILSWILFYLRSRELKRRARVLENKVQERTEALVKANRIKSDFVASMSHEIRNPMNGIIGELRNLQPGAPVAPDTVSSLRQRAFYLNRLVQNILDFSKIESGKLTVQEELFNPAHLGETINLLFQEQAKDQGISLVSDYRGPRNRFVISDRSRLEQVLVNLVANAVRFTPKGSVRVGIKLEATSESEGILRLWVSDSGTGISPEDQQRIFEPFEQGSSSPTGIGEKGTGLGLAIVRDIVQALGGNIHLLSDLGKGTQMYLRFPVQVREADGQSPQERVASTQLSGKFLIVEDLDYNLKIFSEILESWGATVCRAGDANNAFEWLSKDTFDLIFLDWGLPDYTGFEIAELIRKGLFPLNRETPLVAQTAYVSSDYREQARKVGMNGFIDKPITPEKVLEVLREQCPDRVHSKPVRWQNQEESKPPFSLEVLAFMAKSGERELKADVEHFSDELDRLFQAFQDAGQKMDPECVSNLAHKIRGHLGLIQERESIAFFNKIQHLDSLPESVVWARIFEEAEHQIQRVQRNLKAQLELEADFRSASELDPS